MSALRASILPAQQIATTRLGAPTASPSEAFTKITGAVELAGGKLLVADETERRLAIIDLASGAATSVGRVGSGPGEFRAIGRLIPRPDGGAYLVDFALRRLLPVASDGTLQNTIPYPGITLQLHGIDARGVLYGDAFLPRQGTSLPDSMWILRWDPATARADTLMKYDAAVSAMIVLPGQAYHAFAPRDAWAPLPSGDIAVLNAASYRATVWSGGRLAKSAQVPWEPVRVTDAEKAAFNRERAGQPTRTLGQAAGSAPAAPPKFETVFPATMAPFETEKVRMAPDGRLWVERLRAAADTLSRYDVIDGPSGALVGKVVLAPRASIVGFGKGAIFVAERDADDIMYVRRYASPVFSTR